MTSDANSNQPKVIQANEILAKIERGEGIYYDGVIIKGHLDISGLALPTEHREGTDPKLNQGSSKELKVISSQITITNSEVLGKVNFCNGYFQEKINFAGAKFGDDADFEGAEFDRNAYFGRAEFVNNAYFRGVKAGGDTDFERAHFANYADFKDAKFGSYTNFVNAKFDGCACFERTKFGGYAQFWGTKFGGYADFERALFARSANFWGAEFGWDSSFKEAELGEKCNFRGAKFSGDANFEGAKFAGNANFGDAKFIEDAYFTRAKFKKTLNVSGLKYSIFYIEWGSIKDALVYDGPAYQALIKNFKFIEQFDDADNCYYQYKQKSKARKKWYDNKRFNYNKLLDWIGFVSCGYGVRIQPIILWVLGSVLGFTLLYKLLPQSYGGIAESGPSTVTMEAVNNSTLLFTFSSGDGAVSPSWGECLYFSFTALTGGTPDGLHPVGLCKYAVMVEGVLGYLFLALFVVVLARKIIR